LRGPICPRQDSGRDKIMELSWPGKRTWRCEREASP